MAGSWRAKIAPWIPARIGRLPYRAALAALRGFARGGVFGPGVQIWARNSYELGTLVPLVSDLDLTIWFERDPGPKGWARAREAFGALKRAMPWVGEANFYRAEDLPALARLINPYELMRDPELQRRIAEHGGGIAPTRTHAAAFLLRMFESDLEGLRARPSSRELKWRAHFRLVGLQRDPALPLYEEVLKKISALASPEAADLLEAPLRSFLDLGGHLAHLKIDPLWRAMFPHRTCFNSEGEPVPEPFRALGWAQTSWELTGLLAQYPRLTATQEKRTSLSAHLANLEAQGRAFFSSDAGELSPVLEGIHWFSQRIE